MPEIGYLEKSISYNVTFISGTLTEGSGVGRDFWGIFES